MTVALRNLFAFLGFATLLFAPFRVSAGEAEWQAHMKLGMAAYQRGDFRSAAASYAVALKEAEAFGEIDQRLTITINYLALVYAQQGRYAEAEPLYRRTLSINEKALGPDHPSVGTTLNNLAGLFRQQKRWREGLVLARRATYSFAERFAVRGETGRSAVLSEQRTRSFGFEQHVALLHATHAGEAGATREA